MTVGYGALEYVDGPAPAPPRYTLLNSATIVPETGDRWINGTSQHPYSAAAKGLWDPCLAQSSAGLVKLAGIPTGAVDHGSFAAYMAGTCTAVGIYTEQDFKERISRIFAARESALIAAEFWDGALIPENPHLVGGGNPVSTLAPSVLTAAATTNAINGLALLEKAIGATGELGFIHCTPALLAVWTAATNFIRELNGKLLSPNGNIIVPDGGYSGNGPAGAAAAGTVEYAYATGGIEIRRSDLFTTPDNLSQALDRTQNIVTYRAERYYNIVWSRLVHAAVKVDRCQSAC